MYYDPVIRTVHNMYRSVFYWCSNLQHSSIYVIFCLTAGGFLRLKMDMYINDVRMCSFIQSGGVTLLSIVVQFMYGV